MIPFRLQQNHTFSLHYFPHFSCLSTIHAKAGERASEGEKRERELLFVYVQRTEEWRKWIQMDPALYFPLFLILVCLLPCLSVCWMGTILAFVNERLSSLLRIYSQLPDAPIVHAY